MSKDPAVFLINLPRSVDRRRVMEERLATLSLDYTLVPGVDGRAEWDRLAPGLDAKAFGRLTGRDPTPGDVGCYHAHLNTWRAFLETDAQVALVLEDDVVFHDDFHRAVAAAIEASAQWDYLQLNRIRAKLPVRQGRADKWRLNGYVGPATGTGAYLITRALAERLLPRMLPIRLPVDQELDRMYDHQFRHLGLEPFPSHVDDGGESTITGTNFGGQRKWAWYQRLPHYADRIAHLLRKAMFLARSRAVRRNSTDL